MSCEKILNKMISYTKKILFLNVGITNVPSEKQIYQKQNYGNETFSFSY